MGKWQFNKDLLEDSIKMGKTFLLDESLSKRERSAITSDIKKFQLFLDGDFENYQRKRNLSFPYLKNNILNSMKRYQKMFNKDLRNWFIELAQSHIFSFTQEMQTFTLTTKEMVEETLENYQNTTHIFYTCAKNILLNNNIQLIQEATIDSSSYCFYSDILHLPFIVINKDDDAYVLNHEIEHSVEYLLDIQTHPIYSELGPMHFEALFNDKIYTKFGKKTLSGTIDRIKETENFLQIFSIYLLAMNIFETNNFEISDEKFKNVFTNLTGIDELGLIDFLNDEMVEHEISETISYLLSYLKVVEIRDYLAQNNNEGISIFNSLLFSKRFKFEKPKNDFDCYIRFVDETKQKVK